MYTNSFLWYKQLNTDAFHCGIVHAPIMHYLELNQE